MSDSTKTRPAVKKVHCDCEMIREPISCCEMIPNGLAGEMAINGQVYSVRIIGELPEVGEPLVIGYTFEKPDGTVHAVHNEYGQLVCTCGDYVFRRSWQREREQSHCKHTAAVERLLQMPLDVYADQQTSRRPAPRRYATLRPATPRTATQRNASFAHTLCEICGDTNDDPRGCSCVSGDYAEELSAMEDYTPTYINGHRIVRYNKLYTVDHRTHLKIEVALDLLKEPKAQPVFDCDFDDP